MTTTPLSAVNHLLDRMAHTLRILGAVDFPPVPIASFVLPPPFETGLSMALRAVRVEQDTTEMMYGAYSESGKIMAEALRRIARATERDTDRAIANIAKEALAKAGAT